MAEESFTCRKYLDDSININRIKKSVITFLILLSVVSLAITLTSNSYFNNNNELFENEYQCNVKNIINECPLLKMNLTINSENIAKIFKYDDDNECNNIYDLYSFEKKFKCYYINDEVYNYKNGISVYGFFYTPALTVLIMNITLLVLFIIEFNCKKCIKRKSDNNVKYTKVINDFKIHFENELKKIDNLRKESQTNSNKRIVELLESTVSGVNKVFMSKTEVNRKSIEEIINKLKFISPTAPPSYPEYEEKN